MKYMNKKISIILAILMFLAFPVNIFATNNDEILVLGSDLNLSMVNNLKKVYGIEGKNIEQIIITNKEEHEALGKYIDKDIITNKSMSSAYIKLLDEGAGLDVKTVNINWVTEDMYKNALSTAGIKDAQVIVAGPFEVSGTAALTGIMKAYEKLTGEVITNEEKDVANEEMVVTAKLSDKIGKEEAEKLMTEVKLFIAENDVKDEKIIKEAIKKSAEKININISEEDLKNISSLMERISKLELDVDQIKSQIGNIVKRLDKIDIDTEEVKGIIARIFNILKIILDKVFG